MYSDFIFDEKVEFLAFEDQRHFVFILCLKNMGLLDKDYPQAGMLDRVVAKRLGLFGEAFESAKRRLIDSGLIDEAWQPVAWDRRQMRSDADQTATERKRRQRERERGASAGSDVTDVSRVTVTDVTGPDIEGEVDREGESEKKNPADAAFEMFWAAGMVKTGRKAARKAFDAALKREKRDPAEFAEALVKDVKLRIERAQFGFDSLHPSTYLNGNRWEDALPTGKGKGAGRDANGNAVSLTSQQRSFSGVDYGENRIPSWLQDVADGAGAGGQR